MRYPRAWGLPLGRSPVPRRVSDLPRGAPGPLSSCRRSRPCTKTEDREHPVADRSPYGELEIARAEVPTRVNTRTPGGASATATDVAPSRASQPAGAETCPASDPTESPDTTPTAGSPVASDTSGYVPSADRARCRNGAGQLGRLRGRYCEHRCRRNRCCGSRCLQVACPPPVGSAVAMVPAGTIMPRGTARLDPLAVSTCRARSWARRPWRTGRSRRAHAHSARTTVRLGLTRVKAGRGHTRDQANSSRWREAHGELEATLQSVPYELRRERRGGSEGAARRGARPSVRLGGNTRGAVIGG